MVNLRMDQKKLLRVGIIGCGRIGSLWDEQVEDLSNAHPKTHALAYFKNPATQISSVCDISLERAMKAARKWNVPHHTDDLNSFLEKKFDIISICTPVEGRIDLLKALLATQKHCALLIEKPLASNHLEAIEIKNVLDQFTKPALINYSRRFAPGIRKIKNEISANIWGELQAGTGYYGNGFINNGSHLIDLICFLIGYPQKTVKQRETLDNRPGGDITISSTLIYQQGNIQIHGLNHQNYTVFELDLLFTKGRFRFTDRGMKIHTQEIIDDPVYPGFRILDNPAVLSAGYEEAMTRAIEEIVFISQNEINTGISCDVNDAIATASIIEETRRN